MTLALVLLSTFGVVAVGAFVLVTVKLSSANDRAADAIAHEALANQAQLLAEKERDQEKAARVQSNAERDIANATRAAVQAAYVTTVKELVNHVRETVANAAPADAARLLDDQLQQAFLPGAASTGVAASDGGGHAGSTAVQPAAAAGPVDGGAARGR